MKALNKFFIIPAALMLTFAACEDEHTPVFELLKKAEFNSIQNSEVALDKSNITGKFPVITWNAANYNGAAVNYVVKLKNNKTGKEVLLGETTDTSLEIDNSVVNSLAAETGAFPGISSDYTISIVSEIVDYEHSDEGENTLDVKITPYDSKIETVSWNYAYVAVGYPDFNFEKSYLIGDPDGDGTYQGYVNIPDDATSFAVLDGKTFEVISQDNVLNPEINTGFVEIASDEDGNFSAGIQTTWGLIGSATSGAWDKDTKMDFDEATGIWTAISSFTAGEFKFRANSGWDINYGKGDEEFSLAPGGDNFVIEKAHAYIVKLNLVNAGKYTYSIEETEIELSSASLTIPGTFNDWNNKTEDFVITSEARDYVFSGVIYIPTESNEFKFYDDGTGAWIGIVGDIAEDGSFKIGDGDNIKVEKSGYYKFTVDQKKMTASVVATGWELIGEACEFGWDKGIVMDYDPVTKLWSKTITVKDGQYKFRWAGGWDINFGGALNALTQDGDNLSITAGTYTFVLDPEAKTATVTAQ